MGYRLTTDVTTRTCYSEAGDSEYVPQVPECLDAHYILVTLKSADDSHAGAVACVMASALRLQDCCDTEQPVSGRYPWGCAEAWEAGGPDST